MSREVRRYAHQSALFSTGFMTIDRPIQVDRYNQCLEAIGIAATDLHRFRIDAWGWSPEIAEEKNDEFYLSHSGPANPYGIIISPNQEMLKVHFPYYSFDDILIQEIFEKYRNQIADITTEQGIWVDVDQQMAHYHQPLDLLLVDYFNICFRSTGGLIKEAMEQRRLVHDLNNRADAWRDIKLYDQMLESAQSHGDLRYRSLEMADMPFTKVNSFYTKAFGGMFVFRSLPGKKPLVIFEDESIDLEGKPSVEVFHISEKEAILNLLKKEELVRFDAKMRREMEETLRRIRNFKFAYAFAMSYPDQEIMPMDSPGRKSFEKVLLKDGKLENDYLAIDRGIQLLKRNKIKELNQFDPLIQHLVYFPYPWIPQEIKDLISTLLSRLEPNDWMAIYRLDHELFFSAYKDWPQNLQTWCEQELITKKDNP